MILCSFLWLHILCAQFEYFTLVLYLFYDYLISSRRFSFQVYQKIFSFSVLMSVRRNWKYHLQSQLVVLVQQFRNIHLNLLFLFQVSLSLFSLFLYFKITFQKGILPHQINLILRLWGLFIQICLAVFYQPCTIFHKIKNISAFECTKMYCFFKSEYVIYLLNIKKFSVNILQRIYKGIPSSVEHRINPSLSVLLLREAKFFWKARIW